MSSPIAHSLDAYASWRATLDAHLAQFGRALFEQDLLDDAQAALLAALRERLGSDRLVLAFVAEFSRGKSELINAIFFADTGRRVLPATPGRTTMCPVELRHDAEAPPRLALLPIETRLRGLALAELRPRDEHWQHVPLVPQDAASLAQALTAVTRTQRVSVEQAAALGFWDPSQADDNPPQDAQGNVEVPTWRHAIINYPHPLLERGLVVIDTPGLNAIGAEPELTLGLLPMAHAVVFVLAADTGVTKSDLAVWREHLGQASLQRYVVLNKIDTLIDPLATAAEVQLQIEQQRLATAATLEVPLARVFALSARDALAARLAGDAAALQASRLPALEDALVADLLPHRQDLLVQAAAAVVEQLRASARHRLAERRHQQAEQTQELCALRGKSGARLRMMVDRVQAEAEEFERCTARLAALRTVQARMLRDALEPLSSEALRAEVAAMQAASGPLPFNLGGRAAFETLMSRLCAALSRAGAAGDEMQRMIEGSFQQLNTEFGFSFTLGPAPVLAPHQQELDLIQQNYGRYLGLRQAWRMAKPGFAQQFRRMLVSKLRVVFENAAAELEQWSKSAQAQAQTQLRERRRGFARRRESLLRVQSATGELEQRIAEVQVQDEHLSQVQARMDALAGLVTDAVHRSGRDARDSRSGLELGQDAA
jgi:hypothetical protein